MILVDATILVSYFRRPTPEVREYLGSGDFGLAGVTRAELMHGARSPADLAALVAALDSFPHVFTTERTWSLLGEHLRSLRAAGLPMPFQDVLLATVAMSTGAAVWTTDRHFDLMRPHVAGLQLHVPPWTPTAR